MQAFAVHERVRGARMTQVMKPRIRHDPGRVAHLGPDGLASVRRRDGARARHGDLILLVVARSLPFVSVATGAGEHRAMRGAGTARVPFLPIGAPSSICPLHWRRSMLSGDHGCDRLPDPFGGVLDLAVSDMGVAHGHANIAMAEQAGRDGQEHARERGLAGHGVLSEAAQVVVARQP